MSEQSTPTAFEPVRRFSVRDNRGVTWGSYDVAKTSAEKIRASLLEAWPNHAPFTVIETTELPTAELLRLREQCEASARVVMETSAEVLRLREIERAVHKVLPCIQQHIARGEVYSYRSASSPIGVPSGSGVYTSRRGDLYDLERDVKSILRAALARTTDAGTVDVHAPMEAAHNRRAQADEDAQGKAIDLMVTLKDSLATRTDAARTTDAGRQLNSDACARCSHKRWQHDNEELCQITACACGKFVERTDAARTENV